MKNVSIILAKEIKLIEREFDNVDNLNLMLKIIDDPVRMSMFSGLLKIKHDIGDISLGEYLKTKKEQAYKRLFE